MTNPLSGLTRQSMGCMLLASIGAILFGFDNGWWGTILGSPKFLKDYGSCVMVAGVETCNLSTSQVSAGSAVQSAGIMVGCAAAAPVNNLTGRRLALGITAIVSIIGVVIEITSGIGSSARFSQLVVGKVIASISMGMVANIVPVYLSETSPAASRGFAIALYQNIQIIGVIVAAGCVFATSAMNSNSAYLIPIGVQLIAPGLMLMVTPLIPESPRWLVLHGKTEQAEAAANKLLAAPGFDAREYCAKLRLAYEEEQINASKTSWMDLTRNPDLRRTLIAVGIQCLQQAQGSSYMNNYVVSFLQGTGVKDIFPVIMGLYCLYYVGVTIGGILPDIFGRRVILISTGAFCACCLIIIAIITTAVASPTTATQQASIALIFLWEFSFGVQSPLVWITTAESASTANREKVLAVATFLGFGVSLLIASVSPYIQNPGYGNIGSKIGFIWGAFSVVTVFWVFFMVPEMKGFSLEQLDHLYSNNVPTRKFKSYVFADDLLAFEKQDVHSAESGEGEDIESKADDSKGSSTVVVQTLQRD